MPQYFLEKNCLQISQNILLKKYPIDLRHPVICTRARMYIYTRFKKIMKYSDIFITRF